MHAAMGMCEQREDGVALHVKVVPGASRSKLAGVLGDRLKVQVAAPPEAGKANAAACELIATVLGVGKRDVTVVAGRTQPRKTLRVTGLDAAAVADRLGALG